ncbi:hypothetical protein ACFFYR_40310 [Paraburkholderia dipogonis]|uniref:hypothetical protein n=1 Tax=Paraburkholderia dipogonis TaxID=1211383 RepID=UPI0035E7DFA6
MFSLDELDELIANAIASYHGTPHGGLNGVTPLEAMEFLCSWKRAAAGVVAGSAPAYVMPDAVGAALVVCAATLRSASVLTSNLFGVRYTNMVPLPAAPS